MRFREWFERVFVVGPHSEEVVQIDLRPPQRPRLVAVRAAPKRDEWDIWRDNPVTQFVMAALRRNADEHAEQWHEISWQGGNADQRQLDALRERADALRGIAEADYEAFCETLGLAPEPLPESADDAA